MAKRTNFIINLMNNNCYDISEIRETRSEYNFYCCQCAMRIFDGKRKVFFFFFVYRNDSKSNSIVLYVPKNVKKNRTRKSYCFLCICLRANKRARAFGVSKWRNFYFYSTRRNIIVVSAQAVPSKSMFTPFYVFSCGPTRYRDIDDKSRFQWFR